MTQVILDSATLNVNTGHVLLGDLLDELSNHVPHGRIISHLYLDEREVFEQKHELLRTEVLNPVNTVRVITAPIARQILAALSELTGFLVDARPMVKLASRELRFGAVSEATRKLADCFEGLETLILTIEDIAPALPQLGAGFTEVELQHFSRQEGDLLGELVLDFQRSDWSSLANRIEFELDPLLGRWLTVVERIQGALAALENNEAAA